MRIYVPEILGQENQYEEELVEAPAGNWFIKHFYLEANTLEEFMIILQAVESICPKDSSDWHHYSTMISSGKDSITLSNEYQGC